MKRCNKCKELKDGSEFHRDKNMKGGLKSDCKECKNQKSREHHWNNREEKIQRSRGYNNAHREELNQKSKGYRKSLLLYNSTAKMREEIEGYEEVRESENGNTECKCAYDGDGFEPTKQQIQDRIKAINGITEGDGIENRLYCSETCKQSCSIYNKVGYERGYEPTTSREVQPALRKMVFARDGYICVECSWHKDDLIKLDISLHCHHKEGVQQNPLESADTDMCETRCSVCHKKVHQIPGFTYNDLKCPPESKYNS